MSERKDINKLFQEKFENFETTPNEIVWENIEIELKEKKKRRIIPFWWKLSGIAAALLIGLFVYNNSFKSFVKVENGLVNQESKDTKTNGSSDIKPSQTNTNLGTANNPNTTVVNTSSPDAVVTVTNKKEENTFNNKGVTTINKLPKTNSIHNDNNRTGVASSEHNTITNKSNRENGLKNVMVISKNSAEKLAYHTSKHKKSNKNKAAVQSENNNALAIKSSNKKEETSLHNATINKESNNGVANNTIDNNKSVLKSSLKTDGTINKKIDSTKIAIVEPNALEELLNEKESKSITEPKLNRWQVSSNVAPIYFSSISKGSPLDDGLKNNDKSYAANNQSYGIGVNYALNKKLKVRTGVNILNVDYNTNGIVYYQTQSVSGKLANVNPNLIGSSIMIENLSNVNSPFNKMIQKSEGSLNQKIGYIEMPLEITYKVLDKKLGIDFIGGMSTMILNRNEIYLQSSELNLKIGEANNLNNIHFSGNVGLGFKYDIFRRIEARIEPVFKYQINTFNNDAGNFKPFVFGVYSGINFTF